MTQSRVLLGVLLTMVLVCSSNVALGHPLGNFTINHFSRLEIGGRQIKVRYVIDMAEIPTLQELQSLAANGDAPGKQELDGYAERAVVNYAAGLLLLIDDQKVPLNVIAKNIALVEGFGGLQTLRIECDLTAELASGFNGTHRLLFEDNNYLDRAGWREIVISPNSGISVFNSSVYGSPITDELKSYPADRLAAPLDERQAQFSFTSGSVPVGSRALLTREGRQLVSPSRDWLGEFIRVPELTPPLALLGFLIAILLGGLHAMSPGHGKAIVGAYLIGSRGTARHAAFLGLTVTTTHTAGVFALGLATLLASEYVVPERLYPVLSVISGAMVVGIGLSLLVRRVRALLWGLTPNGSSDEHSHEDGHDHIHNVTTPHSHGGKVHTHMPPGTDGSPVTWKSLLLLGISGGLLPCPSALVVLLGAISMHRVGYGLLLVLAFSLGLAGVLTAVGLVFLYLRRLAGSSKRFVRTGSLERVLPAISALVITCAGAAICYAALQEAGVNLSSITRNLTLGGDSSLLSAGALGVLGLGFLYGLKHATEVDHIVAVSTIVSEHRKLKRAAFVGGLWGVGHTFSLILVGAAVLALRIAIPETVASWLEFGVALMIIALGTAAIRSALRRRSDLHVHHHAHGGVSHSHIHFHEHELEHAESSWHRHTIARVGLKPLIVGAMHGLAGSAALTLLVLTQIKSSLLGLIYLGVFGVGSIFGMLMMSGLIGLPFVVTSRKVSGVHYGLQLLAGALSIAFGIWYAYETGFASGLFKTLPIA